MHSVDPLFCEFALFFLSVLASLLLATLLPGEVSIGSYKRFQLT